MYNKIFKLSLLNIKRNPSKNIINIFIIGIFIWALIISTNLSYLIKEYINYNLFENESTRQVCIDIQHEYTQSNINNIINLFEKYDYVDKVTLDTNESGVTNIKILLKNYQDISKAISDFNTNLNSIINPLDYIIYSEGSTEFQQNISKNLKNILDILTLFISILTFICLNIIVKNSIDERIHEIAIYKSVGYKNKYLFSLVLFELLILITISYIFAMLFSKIVLYFILNFISNKTNITLINYNIFYQYIYPLLLLYFISIFISYLTLFKIKKLSLKMLLID